MLNVVKIIVVTLAVLDYLVTPGTVGHMVAKVVVALGRTVVAAASKVA